ncbi:MAG TPA: exodeoxyribonuclease III [Candidatus Polarisedimenticolaceae bacterium]|nr:exodeoxyribonuclease III [Candidatus Polarisedimenticolaceae bacterium]
MRLATWNVNGLRARLDFVLHWLRARQPDVVGLQELKLEDAQFPHAELEALGYAAVVHGQKGWNGVAVLTRATAGVTQRGLPGQESAGARLLTVETAGLAFTTVYCPNGKSVHHPDFPVKLAWYDALVRHLGERLDPSRPAVLCGDFNLCATDLDTWNEAALRGTIFHTDEERSRFRRLLETGLHDLFREQHPGLRAFSWWDYRAGAFHRGQGMRLDLLLATPSLRARLRAIEIDREYRKKKDALLPSDHAPVFADLE